MSNKLVYKTSEQMVKLGRLLQESVGFESINLSKEDQKKAMKDKLRRLKDKRINNKDTVLLVTGGTKRGSSRGWAKSTMSIAQRVLSNPGWSMEVGNK